MFRYIVTFVFMLIATLGVVGQETHHDTTLKNVVRLNITPALLTGRVQSFTIGYERMLGKRQTISANIGHLQLPTLLTTEDGDPVQGIENLHNSGFIASVDYRFYFARNKYPKPDGLYWGPYVTYYYFDNESSLSIVENDVITGEATLQLYSNIVMVGAQLGYQFVIGNRWTIDLIMFGPGAGWYNFNARLRGDSEITGDPAYVQGAYDALVAIFPGAEQLFDDKHLDDSGTSSFSGAGFRYVFQVGYRF